MYTELSDMFQGPSNTGHPSIGFQAAHEQRYKILLLCPVCGVCAVRQLIVIFVASRQKYAPRGIELTLFSTPDAWY